MEPDSGGEDHSEKKPSIIDSVRLIAWSFLGVRSKHGYRNDLAKVNPLHVVLVGLVSIFLLVIGLIVLVNWVVAK